MSLVHSPLFRDLVGIGAKVIPFFTIYAILWCLWWVLTVNERSLKRALNVSGETFLVERHLDRVLQEAGIAEDENQYCKRGSTYVDLESRQATTYAFPAIKDYKEFPTTFRKYCAFIKEKYDYVKRLKHEQERMRCLEVSIKARRHGHS